MSETTDKKDPILARIERLERQNSRLKRGALACLVAIMSVGLMGQTQRKTTRPAASAPAAAPVLPKNIEAESFILKDANGHVRAELSMGRDWTELQASRSERHGIGYAVTE